MTEKIIKKENVEYKLTCSLFMEWNRPAWYIKYRFKLQQRECGKRKWLNLKGEECTEKDIILQHISEEDMLELAFEEYKKYNPSNSNMF